MSGVSFEQSGPSIKRTQTDKQAAVRSQVDDERWLLLEQSVLRGLARFKKCSL